MVGPCIDDTDDELLGSTTLSAILANIVVIFMIRFASEHLLIKISNSSAAATVGSNCDTNVRTKNLWKVAIVKILRRLCEKIFPAPKKATTAQIAERINIVIY